jgi:hypothetical protein
VKLLSSIQQIIISKNIDKIVYNPTLVFTKYKSNLSNKLNIDFWSMIKNPPLNSSQKTTNELTQVISLANNRIHKEIDLIYLVDKNPIKLFLPYINKYNIKFSYENFSNLYIYLRQMIKDLKYFYNRARPFQLADFYNVKLDVIQTKTHHTPSYPSGHTAYAALAACILSEQRPEDSNYIWSLVDQCGLARILQGVHFNSDNRASIDFVQRVYPLIKEFDNKYF